MFFICSRIWDFSKQRLGKSTCWSHITPKLVGYSLTYVRKSENEASSRLVCQGWVWNLRIIINDIIFSQLISPIYMCPVPSLAYFSSILFRNSHFIITRITSIQVVSGLPFLFFLPVVYHFIISFVHLSSSILWIFPYHFSSLTTISPWKKWPTCLPN